MAVLHFSSTEELARQLSPSRWSKRMSAYEVVQCHLTNTKAATEVARKLTKCTTDIQYCNSGATIDIYYPSNTKEADYSDCPVLMFIYGGYWHLLSKDNGGVMAIPFTQAGVILVVVSHTPCIIGKATMSQIVDECRSACCFVRNKFPSNRLFLSGHSSGSHLAFCVMCTNWDGCKMNNPNIAGLIFYSGYFDLEVFQKHEENTTVGITDQEARAFTPKYNTQAVSTPKDCSCLFYYAEYDPDEFKRQGKEWMKALTDCGIKCKYEVLPELDHFDIIENLQFVDNKLNMEVLHFIKDGNNGYY